MYILEESLCYGKYKRSIVRKYEGDWFNKEGNLN